MRGIFTAGVLDYFLEENIWFENLIGVSAGACHATSYLSEQYKRALNISIDYLNDKRYCSFSSVLKTGDLFGVDFVYDEIPNKLNPYDYNAFLKSKTTFYATVANCVTGKAEYMKVQDMRTDMHYVRASSSLPGVSRFVCINDIPYLDGGIVDSIPIRESIRRGNKKHIVVLTQHYGYRKGPMTMGSYLKRKYRDYPAFVEQMINRHLHYNKTLDFIAEQEIAGNIFVIRPPEALNVRRIEKSKEKLLDVYRLGYEAAKKSKDALQEYLTR